MTQYYNILNPITGQYTSATAVDASIQILAETAWNFYLSQTHGNPISLITVNDNGTQTWKAFDGAEFIRGAVLTHLTHITGNATTGVPAVLNLTILGDENV
jgi:hypothetical protein